MGAQGLGQACNFACQLTLIALLGKEAFVSLGLGLMAANSVVFLGEIGLGTYFLRESATRDDWLPRWQMATGSRLVGVLIAFVLAWVAIAWAAPAPTTAHSVLLWSIPGLLASVVNPLPILFGLGHIRTASFALFSRFVLQSLLCLLIAAVFPLHSAMGIGLAFSAGLILQVIIGQWAGLPPATLCPRRPRSLPPPAAMRLWALSLVGTLHDRSLPFIVSTIRPDLLAVVLLGVQVLQTLSGILSQLDRLLIPATARTGDMPPAAFVPLLLKLLVLSGTIALVIMVTAIVWLPDHRAAVVIFACEWVFGVGEGAVFAFLFARAAERPVTHLMLVVVPLSTIVQVSLSGVLPLEAMLTLRLLVVTLVALQMRRSFRALTPSSAPA